MASISVSSQIRRSELAQSNVSVKSKSLKSSYMSLKSLKNELKSLNYAKFAWRQIKVCLLLAYFGSASIASIDPRA